MNSIFLSLILCIFFGLNCTLEKQETKGPSDGKDGTFGPINGSDGEDGKDAT